MFTAIKFLWNLAETSSFVTEKLQRSIRVRTSSELMNDPYRKTNCRYCGTPLAPAFLNLGAVALANSYVRPEDAAREEFKCPLSLTQVRTMRAGPTDSS